ncbi:MAG: cyclopropane-fatty-acyl-phospholipid synthase family protein [Bryobacteraceae bacterium]
MRFAKSLPAFVRLAGLVLCLSPAFAQEEDTDPPPIYVPSPQEVVDEMLKLAEVKKTDAVYDLGCGDGRIVISAAKLGARGVGIDINPERIKEANDNAQREGVTERVTFRNEDLFTTDLSPATVVTLYLLPARLTRLRPKLWKELRPGTRIVAHDFDLGDWKPEKTIEIGGHRLFFWTIPEGKSQLPQTPLPAGP